MAAPVLILSVFLVIPSIFDVPWVFRIEGRREQPFSPKLPRSKPVASGVFDQVKEAYHDWGGFKAKPSISACPPKRAAPGVGRALARACLARARRDCAAVFALHTSELISVALPVYQRMGFELVSAAPMIHGVPYGIYPKRLDA